MSSVRRARWALVIVGLVELGLFALHHRDQWQQGLVRIATPQALTGEGLVVHGDGLGYYAWLRSALIDHDWSFDNEFDEHNPFRGKIPGPNARTALGLRANPWSIGPACVWSLGVVPGHLLLQMLQPYGVPWPADGYSLPYQLLVGAITLVFSLAGLAFLYGICRQFARPVRAALAATFLTLGTTVVYYTSIEPSMGHALGTTALAALVWYWLRYHGSTRAGRWFVVGVLVGVAALMRWQLACFAALPAGEALLACWNGCRMRSRQATCQPLLGLAVAAVGAGIAFSPQMVAWHHVYGHWLGSPLRLRHNWLQPSLWEVLGSQNRSLFYWTPLSLLAVAGFFSFRRQAKPVASAPLLLLAGTVLLQIYILASIRGDEVFLGSSFGFRQLTETLVALAPGMALLLERATPRWYRALGVLGCVLVLWNLLLICEYRYLLLPPAGGASPARLLRNLFWLVHAKPIIVIGQIVVPLAIGLLLCRAEKGPATRGNQQLAAA